MRVLSIVNTQHYWYAKGYKLIIIMHEIKASEITFLLVQKVFLCIEELTRHEAMKLTFSVLPCCHHVKSVTNGHFISCDLFIYYLNLTGVMSKVTVRKVDRSYVVWLSYGCFSISM